MVAAIEVVPEISAKRGTFQVLTKVGREETIYFLTHPQTKLLFHHRRDEEKKFDTHWNMQTNLNLNIINRFLRSYVGLIHPKTSSMVIILFFNFPTVYPFLVAQDLKNLLCPKL